VLEQLLLPAVEEVRMEVVLLADLGDGFVLQQVESQDLHLLLSGKLSSRRHEHSLSK